MVQRKRRTYLRFYNAPAPYQPAIQLQVTVQRVAAALCPRYARATPYGATHFARAAWRHQ